MEVSSAGKCRSRGMKPLCLVHLPTRPASAVRVPYLGARNSRDRLSLGQEGMRRSASWLGANQE